MAMPRKPRKSSALVGTWVAASAGAAWSIVSSSPSPSRGEDRPDDDQGGARKRRERRRFGEEHEAEDRRPDQRRIVEGGERRRLGPGIGARHEIMAADPEHRDQREKSKVLSSGRSPHRGRQGREDERRADILEEDDVDDRIALGAGAEQHEPKRIEQRRGKGRDGARERARLAAAAELVRDHDEHAEKT